MDVGGGTTDIAVLNEGGVQGTKMFGIGGRAFTRSIERDMGVTFDEAESLKLTLSKGATPAAKKKAVEKALNKTVKVWRSGVELALEEFKGLDHLPHNILLCGGGASLDMLVEELEETSWYRSLPFSKKPSIQYISPEAAVGIIDTTEKLDDHTFITAMGLLRVGMDTIDQTDEKDSDSLSVKDRINRILKI
jgi:cell division protein FtsA